jgi:protein gp37
MKKPIALKPLFDNADLGIAESEKKPASLPLSKGVKLDYSDYTFGIVQGCAKVSHGCAHCYAEEDAQNWGINVGGLPVWGQNALRKTHGEDHWNEPLKWEKDAANAEDAVRPPLVFSSPMADVFEDHPTVNQERPKLWDLIQQTPNLNWHIVTKRHDNIEKNLPWSKIDKPWSNLWISVSVENDYWANKRLPIIASLNIAVRGAHLEPLLGQVPSLAQYINQLDWVLVGGESRDNDPPKARIMQPAWVKDIKAICNGAGVPFFFKQWGSQKPVAVNPDGSIKFKAVRRWQAGYILMGKVYRDWPVPKIGKPR